MPYQGKALDNSPNGIEGIILTPPQADVYIVRTFRTIGDEIIHETQSSMKGTLAEMTEFNRVNANYFIGSSVFLTQVQLSETCFVFIHKNDDRRWWIFVDALNEATEVIE